MKTTTLDFNLKNFLKDIRDIRGQRTEEWVYHGMEDCLLQEGHHVLSSLERPDWMQKGIPKQCYANAARLVMKYPNLRYVEGYGVCHDVPMLHAWVYDVVENRHYDPTWEDRGLEYYGTIFEDEFLLMYMHKTERYGVWGGEHYKMLTEYMKNGFPAGTFHK